MGKDRLSGGCGSQGTLDRAVGSSAETSLAYLLLGLRKVRGIERLKVPKDDTPPGTFE
jgi:hypothetical protein